MNNSDKNTLAEDVFKWFQSILTRENIRDFGLGVTEDGRPRSIYDALNDDKRKKKKKDAYGLYRENKKKKKKDTWYFD